MYVVLLSCTECVVHGFGQSRSPSFPLGKFPHERSLSLSEVTVPSAGRQFATAPSGGRRVAREKEERERERVCVCEKESASASVGVGVCGDLARAREIVRSSSKWDRRGGIGEEEFEERFFFGGGFFWVQILVHQE
jgi:hypothetical protein